MIRRILNILKEYAYSDYEAPKSVYQIYKEDQNYQCFLHFKELLKSTLLLNTNKIREHAIVEAIKNDAHSDGYYLEFGVYSGTSIRFFSKYLKKNDIYGFDSFEGLKEHWFGTTVTKGTFDLKKKNTNLTKKCHTCCRLDTRYFKTVFKRKKPKN